MKAKAITGMRRGGRWERPAWLKPFGSGGAVLASLSTTLALAGLGVLSAVSRQPHILQGDGRWDEFWNLLWPAELAAYVTAGLVMLMLLHAIWPAIVVVARAVQLGLTALLSGATRVLRAVLLRPMWWMARHLGAALRWAAAVIIQPTCRQLILALVLLGRLLAGMVDRALIKGAWPPIRHRLVVLRALLIRAVRMLVHVAIAAGASLARMLSLLRLLGVAVGRTLVKSAWLPFRRTLVVLWTRLTWGVHVLAQAVIGGLVRFGRTVALRVSTAVKWIRMLAQLTSAWALRPLRKVAAGLFAALRVARTSLMRGWISLMKRLVFLPAALVARQAFSLARRALAGLGHSVGSLLLRPLVAAGRGLGWLLAKLFNGLAWVVGRLGMAIASALQGARWASRTLWIAIAWPVRQALGWLIRAAGTVLAAMRAGARSGLSFLAQAWSVVGARWTQADQALTAVTAGLRARWASFVTRLALELAVQSRVLLQALARARAPLRAAAYMPRRHRRLWQFAAVGGALAVFASCQPTARATPCSNANSRTVEVCIYSSDTKQDWLNAVISSFNAEQVKTKAGKPISVYAFHVNSGTSQQDILSGKIRPVVWSPGDQSWVDGANQAWRETHDRPLIPNACQATVFAPVGFAMWRPMAEALGWPDTPVSWDTLVALSADPQGWGRYGHPEWGAFKFGHTHPDHSNSGLLLLTALAYSTFDRTSGLTPEMVESQPFVDALRSVERNTYHYGLRSKDLLGLMVRRGPDYLHATNTSEADTLKTNREQAEALRFPLAFIFPAEGTFWTEQPYCVLDADWVSPDQREAAQVFEAYLHERAQQTLAVSFNLRPVDSSIPLGAPFTLENGTDPRVTLKTVPALTSPSGEVAEAVKRVFHETKKKATVLLVLDTSGSMGGDKIKNAREATANFIGRLEAEDEVAVMAFASSVRDLEISGQAGEIAGRLSEAVLQQQAEGGTALYDAVCAATDRLQRQQADDLAAGAQRLYGVVLLSDGMDTAKTRSREDMFNCLPSGEEVEGIRVYTIAYGSDADKGLLEEIARRTNGKAFSADPATIEQVYLAISAEQ